MNFPDFNLWTLCLNISGSLIWLLLIGRFFKSRSKFIHRRRKRKNIDSEKTFNEEMFVQMLKQQAELSLKRIADTIAREQLLFWSFIEEGTLGAAKNLLSDKAGKDFVEVMDCRHKGDPLAKMVDDDKYSEALRLAHHGMPSEKISRIVDLPKSEVDLLIKVRDYKKSASAISG